MLKSYGEFFNQAVETSQTGKLRKKKTLKVYEGVMKLPRNDDAYERAGMQHSGTPRVFDATELKFGDFNSLKTFHKKHASLVEYLYSRSFEKLPEKIIEDAIIYLPEPKQVWPVGRGNFYNRFDVSSYVYVDWASRGVRPRGQKINRNL